MHDIASCVHVCSLDWCTFGLICSVCVLSCNYCSAVGRQTTRRGQDCLVWQSKPTATCTCTHVLSSLSMEFCLLCLQELLLVVGVCSPPPPSPGRQGPPSGVALMWGNSKVEEVVEGDRSGLLLHITTPRPSNWTMRRGLSFVCMLGGYYCVHK